MNFFALAPRRFFALLVTIAAMIALWRYGPAHGFTPFAIRMGAGAFRAAAIYFIVALLLRDRPRRQILVVAALVCAAIELSKLTHTPALDIFRLTPVGTKLLGRLFSWLNFAAYAAGLICALVLDALLAGGLLHPLEKRSRARRKR